MSQTVSSKYEAKEIIYECSCPACDYQIAVPFYDGGYQPLAERTWPRSAIEAKNMLRLPLSFKRCVGCGHVFNSEFDNDDMPSLYINPDHNELLFPLPLREQIEKLLPDHASIVDISTGQQEYLHLLAQNAGQHRYIGFNPFFNEKESNDTVELRAEIFDPLIHIPALKPDLLLVRHRLCDIKNPSAFLQTLDFAVRHEKLKTLVAIEVSCIDEVFKTDAIASLYYEKHSHYTRHSLTKMLKRSTQQVIDVMSSSDGEKLYALAYLGGVSEGDVIESSLEFWKNAKASKETIHRDLARLHASGRSVAVWGKGGKCAAFLNFFGLDKERFPVVIESDGIKVGSYIPGTGQEVHSPSFLKENEFELILVPMQWMAKEVRKELEAMGIKSTILVESKGEFVEYQD